MWNGSLILDFLIFCRKVKWNLIFNVRIYFGYRNLLAFLCFQLHFVRRCGFANDIFYIEVGRSAVTGDGEFWMAVEDNNIALNMYDVITTAMRNSKSNKDEVGPRQRMRSSSANEASKPISVLQRRHMGHQKLHGFSPLGKLRDSPDPFLSFFFCFLRTRARMWVMGHYPNVTYRPFIEMCFSRV